MVIDTRSTPEFPHDSQKELYTIRREFALTVKFPYDPEYEQTYIGTMTAERASEVLAKTAEKLEAYKKRISRKSKGKVTTTAATETTADASGEAPTGDDGALGDAPPANETAPNENSAHEPETDSESVYETDPSDSSDSSSGSDDDDDDPR